MLPPDPYSTDPIRQTPSWLGPIPLNEKNAAYNYLLRAPPRLMFDEAPPLRQRVGRDGELHNESSMTEIDVARGQPLAFETLHKRLFKHKQSMNNRSLKTVPE